MDCDKYQELLSALLDGALTEAEEQELKDHLLRCPDCRELARHLVQIQDGIAGLEELPAPEGFAQGVMDRIRAETPVKKPIPLFKRPAFQALAGLAACLALAVGIYSASQDRSLDGYQIMKWSSSDAGAPSGSAGEGELEPGMMARTVPGPDSASVDGVMPLDDIDPVENGPIVERWSRHAAMALERLPDGAAELIGPEVAVSYNEETGEEGYSWLTGDGPEALDQIERLAGEQGMNVARSSAPVGELWYDLVVYAPDR